MICGGSDDVEHGSRGDLESGRAEWEREDSAEMILVLRGFAGFYGIMARIMRPWRDLVQVY